IPLSAYSDQREQYSRDDLYSQNEVWIRVTNLEEAIIQRVIEDGNIQRELSIAVEKLRGREVLDIYTDGSLEGTETGNNIDKRMGIGWIVASNENSSLDSISFSSRIADWPSSTRAELSAI